MRLKALVAIGVSLAAVAGASDSTAQQRTRTLSQSAVAQAAQQHPQVVAEFGGEEGGARGAYVRGVGARVGAQTNISSGSTAFRVTTLNSPVMNAFAVPGGYLYITRQLLALMNDEAELALVLGHEAGHIAARHSAERQRTNILTQLGALILGAVSGSSAIAQLAGTVGQGLILQYSRSQELESDELGIRYMTAAGYDPMAAPSILANLGAWSNLEARFRGRDDDQRATPEWARTHPLSSTRVSRATQRARATGRAGAGVRNREQHMAAIHGMYFDDDPRQGIVEGRDFFHPDLRLAFSAPQGFGIQNGTRAVSVVGSSGQAQFSTGAFSGNLDAYVGQVFRALTGGRTAINYTRPEHRTINGIPVAISLARVPTNQGIVDVGVVAYAFANNRAYHFATITRGGSGFGPFGGMVQSVRRLNAQEVATIRPRIIQVVTVAPGDTEQRLASRMAYSTYQLERFRALNGLGTSSSLQPGQRVKLVVYGQRVA